MPSSPVRTGGARGPGVVTQGADGCGSPPCWPCVVGSVGCAARPPSPPPSRGAARPETLPARFSIAGDLPTADRWWTVFEDPVLDRLVARALYDSFTLQAARERVIEAAALARRAGAPLRPQLDASATVGGITRGATRTPAR